MIKFINSIIGAYAIYVAISNIVIFLKSPKIETGNENAEIASTKIDWTRLVIIIGAGISGISILFLTFRYL